MKHEQHELFEHIGIWRREIIENMLSSWLDACQSRRIRIFCVKRANFHGWDEQQMTTVERTSLISIYFCFAFNRLK
jgi:hypothetical protein